MRMPRVGPSRPLHGGSLSRSRRGQTSIYEDGARRFSVSVAAEYMISRCAEYPVRFDGGNRGEEKRVDASIPGEDVSAALGRARKRINAKEHGAIAIVAVGLNINIRWGRRGLERQGRRLKGAPDDAPVDRLYRRSACRGGSDTARSHHVDSEAGLQVRRRSGDSRDPLFRAK